MTDGKKCRMRECGESQKVVEYLNFNSVDNFKKKGFRKKQQFSTDLPLCEKNIYVKKFNKMEEHVFEPESRQVWSLG